MLRSAFNLASQIAANRSYKIKEGDPMISLFYFHSRITSAGDSYGGEELFLFGVRIE